MSVNRSIQSNIAFSCCFARMQKTVGYMTKFRNQEKFIDVEYDKMPPPAYRKQPSLRKIKTFPVLLSWSGDLKGRASNLSGTPSLCMHSAVPAN